MNDCGKSPSVCTWGGETCMTDSSDNLPLSSFPFHPYTQKIKEKEKRKSVDKVQVTNHHNRLDFMIKLNL